MTDLERVVERLRDLQTLFQGCENDLSALDQAIALLEAGKWRPAETAPEGKRVLLYYVSTLGDFDPYFDVKERCNGEFIFPSRFYKALYWKPLDAPPRNQGGGE